MLIVLFAFQFTSYVTILYIRRNGELFIMYSTLGPWSILSFPHHCLCTISLCGFAHLAEIWPLGVFHTAGLCGSLGDFLTALFWLF